VILLQTGAVGLLGNEGEEGLVCSAKIGLLPIAGEAWGSSHTHSLTSSGDIGTGSYLSMEMGSHLDTGDGFLNTRGSYI
jgi:hypothetical protein